MKKSGSNYVTGLFSFMTIGRMSWSDFFSLTLIFFIVSF